MDTVLLSKIERGLRQMKREQIGLLAGIYKTDKKELETLWLAGQIIRVVKDSNTASEAISVAENQIKLRKQTDKTRMR